MASIILKSIGARLGGQAGGALGSALGGALGSYLGGRIDRNLFRESSPEGNYGARLSDLVVQSSSYGQRIAWLYGTCRLAGNIIWALPIAEQLHKRRYSYSISLAIALCHGQINALHRIWADAKILDLSLCNYRLYLGDEAQLPDPLIESHMTIGKTPAYRGLAYIVIEDFPLEAFNNHIPNFTFEISKQQGSGIEDRIRSMVVIPGCGEFVYDTVIRYKIYGISSGGRWIQQGKQQAINAHNYHKKADSLVALDQLQNHCRNLEWVAPVVGWFGNSLDIEHCVIRPGVEYRSGSTTEPDVWQVAGITREQGYAISRCVNAAPSYGGSPSDLSIIRYLDELKARGLKVMFYPLLFMDVVDKPWRGRLSGDPEKIEQFFQKKGGYNEFILHYAELVKGRVDAFVIGSELIGLTRLRNNKHEWVAVMELVRLAQQVKAVVGNVIVTYAADWSEYHHTEGGWYNLDLLWSSPAIDVIGINAYFPLTEGHKSCYDVSELKNAWASGEGYNWYYKDEGRTMREPLHPPYAWKNIEYWWNNVHVNPDGQQTAWTPRSKKLWFTEYGFPSVDKASHQPNLFFDPVSCESGFPRGSTGDEDFQAQYTAIDATLQAWQNSAMVENMFLWCFDARPYPFWPDFREVWRDGYLWSYGHWVNGKLGLSSLAAVVADLCYLSGLGEADIDVSQLRGLVDGYVVMNQKSARVVLEELQRAYFFDSVERAGQLVFVPYAQEVNLRICDADLVMSKDNAPLLINYMSVAELPAVLELLFCNKHSNYGQGLQMASRGAAHSHEVLTLSLGLVLSDVVAKNIAEQLLFNSWTASTSYHFLLSSRYYYLELGDIIEVQYHQLLYTMRILQINFEQAREMEISAVAYEEPHDHANVRAVLSASTSCDILQDFSKTWVRVLDLPALTGEELSLPRILIAASELSGKWMGSEVELTSNGKVINQTLIQREAVMGHMLDILTGNEHAEVRVILVSGELFSSSPQQLQAKENLALIGKEIVQFTRAELIEPYFYKLSGLRRGRYGTEIYIDNHLADEEFILLDDKLTSVALSLAYLDMLISFGQCEFIYRARSARQNKANTESF